MATVGAQKYAIEKKDGWMERESKSETCDLKFANQSQWAVGDRNIQSGSSNTKWVEWGGAGKCK